MIDVLTTVTAVFGAVGLFRAMVGAGRGAPSPSDTEWRLLRAAMGGSLLVVAGLVAAPLGLFGAWAAALALCVPLALVRPTWVVPGRRPDRRRGALGYGILALIMAVLHVALPGISGPLAAGDPWFPDIVALVSLLIGRSWLWRSRSDSPVRRLRAADEARVLEGGAWWDRVWSQHQVDAGLADVADSEPAAAGAGAEEARGAKAQAAGEGDPGDPDATLEVPGYDPELLVEELAAFREHRDRIERVALAWPSHPVSEALMHVSVILRETRTFLQKHPDKYRDLRPILVGHAATASDIARLVDRIKGTGEALDDAEGVATRLFALANLMRETRRKSTQAERDRLKASMAVIDDELSALSAMRDLRARMDRESGAAARPGG
ncbi:hypothetical protein [uncultured Rhodospira sp.]|uniref:hypothetical protein n=1 Tax=uncultured Rhodospira sp. TaxID=1936189 RepID=UPI00260E26F8|nr:hypothetical protein [uncultured Rhodospira sp.]